MFAHATVAPCRTPENQTGEFNSLRPTQPEAEMSVASGFWFSLQGGEV